MQKQINERVAIIGYSNMEKHIFHDCRIYAHLSWSKIFNFFLSIKDLEFFLRTVEKNLLEKSHAYVNFVPINYGSRSSFYFKATKFRIPSNENGKKSIQKIICQF